MMKTLRASAPACLSGLAVAVSAAAQAAAAPVAPPGYIYSGQLLSNTTQNCIAAGPGGTFVGVGRGFTANAQSIVLARESGELRLVAAGFNSIGDCAYDPNADVLYVTDNADNGDLMLTPGMAGNTGAQTGDTIYRIPNASSANGLPASSLSIYPAGTYEYAANVAVEADGDLVLTTAEGSSNGQLLRVSAGPSASVLRSGFDFTGGTAVDPDTGDIFVVETRSGFDVQLHRFTPAGAVVASPLLGPSYAFGSADLAVNADGSLLASGVFGGDVVSIDPDAPVAVPFVVGFTYATGISVHPFTERVEILSSTFSGMDEDKTIHRFVPISKLVPGAIEGRLECLHEFYGVELEGSGPVSDVRTSVCIDGTACDADGQENDRCVFPVGSCLNVNDSRLPECAAADPIRAYRATSSRYSSALADLSAAATGAIPFSGSLCVFSDGVTVPVKVASGGTKKPGKGKVSIQVETTGGESDKDTLTLECHPAP